jgi:hypothetical protein
MATELVRGRWLADDIFGLQGIAETINAYART